MLITAVWEHMDYDCYDRIVDLLELRFIDIGIQDISRFSNQLYQPPFRANVTGRCRA